MDRDAMDHWSKTLPNKLTLARVAVIPVLLILYPLDFQFLNVFCGILFLLAALTDFFDGYLARRYQTESKLGAILDPIADKILVTAALILLTNVKVLPAFLAALLLAREIGISGLRQMALERQFSIPVDQLGKIKTGVQDLGIFCLMIKVPNFYTIGMIAIWAALGLSYYSAWRYWQYFSEHSNRRPPLG